MNLIDTFESPFKLIFSHQYRDPCNGLRVTYKTKNIYDETTKEEIYIISKMYFDNFVSAYKRYLINDRPTTESSYRLYVEQIEDGEIDHKHVYSIAYNNIEDRISWENKFDDNFTVEGNFRIGIDITAYVFEDNEDEDDEDYEVKTMIKEEDCVVCYEKINLIFYTQNAYIA